MAQTKEEEDGLLGFNWEGEIEGDFFGVKEEEEEVVVVKPKPTETKKEEEEEEEEEEAPDFFGDEEEEEEEADPDKPTKKPSSGGDKDFYTDVYQDLKDQGIFKHVELEEGEELNADRLLELQEQEYNAEVQSRLTTWAQQELDEDAQAFIKFKTEGGDTKAFFDTYSKSTDLPTGSITDEDYQDQVIRYQLKKEGWDSDEVEDRLNYLTESGRKEKVAKKYDTKVKESIDADKAATVAQAGVAKQAALQQEQEFKANIKDTLAGIKEVKGVKITSKDTAKLYDLLTKKNVKVGDNKSITGFQKKLGEVFQDTEKMILLAKLVDSDFDLKDFEKATVTKKTRQIKSNLEQRKSLRPTNSGSSLEGNSLADLF